MLFKALICVVIAAFALTPVYAAEPVSLSAQERELFELVNRERVKNRLNALRWDEGAARIAREFSRQMAREGFFSHVDRKGDSVVERAGRLNLKGWSRIGENLFAYSGTERYTSLAVKGWMRSRSHRRNILDRSWTASGIGIARGRDGKILITQVFVDR